MWWDCRSWEWSSPSCSPTAWKISLASVVANVATALLLVIIGVVGYREHLAARHVVGLLMCLGGLVLVARP